MPDRRTATLIAGLTCFGLGLVLAVLVATGTLDSFDRSLGEPLVVESGSTHRGARIVEAVFEFWPFVIYIAALAGALWWKGYRRAAVYVLIVNASTFVVSQLVKHVVGRDRPEWQDPMSPYTGLAYPSGHVIHAAAFFGVTTVLALIFIRKVAIRRLVVTVSVLLTLVVVADRLLLGRHHLTDVTGGLLFGIGLVLFGLVLYSPLPLSQAVKAEPLTEVYAGNRRCAVVLNPSKVESVGQFQSIVNSMARESGWHEPRWYLTTVEDSGTGQAEQAAVEGAELVLVCGGDGTVREVCAELAGTGIPVGIIPAGTGNLLARNLAIPLYLRAAIDVGLTGQDRAVDMVRVEGDGVATTHFLVMAGMGFDAAIMEGVNEDIKAKVGWFAYVLSALKSLMFPAIRVEISVDDAEFTKHRARTIVVGNVGTLQAGMPLLPDAEIDDGLLDVVLLHPQRFWSWVPLAFRVLAKRPQTDDLVNRMTGRTVIIRADRDTPRQLDGDTIGSGRELRMTNVHGRLLIRVPR